MHSKVYSSNECQLQPENKWGCAPGRLSTYFDDPLVETPHGEGSLEHSPPPRRRRGSRRPQWPVRGWRCRAFCYPDRLDKGENLLQFWLGEVFWWTPHSSRCNVLAYLIRCNNCSRKSRWLVMRRCVAGAWILWMIELWARLARKKAVSLLFMSTLSYSSGILFSLLANLVLGHDYTGDVACSVTI